MNLLRLQVFGRCGKLLTVRMLRLFSIITTEPNELMKLLHNRMPVIIKQENEEKWLQEIDISEAQKMLEPYPFEDLEAYPISTLVNSPRNNSEEIIKALT